MPPRITPERRMSNKSTETCVSESNDLSDHLSP
jgi:hypothetical protein